MSPKSGWPPKPWTAPSTRGPRLDQLPAVAGDFPDRGDRLPGQVDADNDGPVEWCIPAPSEQAHDLAEQFPELTLRIEPAHREAFVVLPASAEWNQAEWQLASEALHGWAADNGITRENLELTPDDLGSRITYLASAPITETNVPDRDFAVPFTTTIA